MNTYFIVWKNVSDFKSILFWYSVIQSDRNSSCCDVVLDSADLVVRDEGKIFDEIYETQIYSEFYYEYIVFLSG